MSFKDRVYWGERMKNTLHWGSTPHYVRYGHPKGYCKCKPAFVKRGLLCDPCRERKREEEE